MSTRFRLLIHYLHTIIRSQITKVMPC
jgi:hypothetical protein